MPNDDIIEGVEKHPAIKVAFLTGTAITGALGFAAVVLDLRPTLDSAGGFFVFAVGLVLLAFVIGIFVATYFAAQRNWKRQVLALEDNSTGLQKTVGELERRSEDLTQQVDILKETAKAVEVGEDVADRHDRFEDIEGKPIRLGWIPFHPTLKYDEVADEQTGPGPDVLNAVFSGRVSYHPRRSNWENIIAGLIQGEYDVVATPLYDIRERRKEVEFTLPIFYADIGLFVSTANHRVFDGYLEGKKDLTFVQAKDLLKDHAKEMKFCVHRGELQHKMISKYFKEATIRGADRSEFSVPAALSAMVRGNDAYSSDLYFCERVQGEAHKDFGKSLINVLLPGQLLFPVAFALRKTDDTLRKFMNLRLLSIDGENDSGIKRQLVKSAQGIVSDSLVGKIDQYFLRHRDPVKADGLDDLSKDNVFHFRK